MDEIVKRAMARWPNVPAVYGWLALDRRGRWRLREDPVEHPGTVDFFNRNYAADRAGCWFVQNGPQRVFVDLDGLPLALSLDGAGTLVAHTGAAVGAPAAAWIDEAGALLLETELGPGLVDDRDVERLAEGFVGPCAAPVDDDRLERLLEAPAELDAAALELAVAGTRVPVRTIRASRVPERLGFVPRPRGPSGATG